MANLRAIRTRIKSVENTQQITKSMKMVAAAKLRRTQTAFSALKEFAGRSDAMLRQVSDGDAARAHPLLMPHEKNQRVCYVLIVGNRGLCGTYNQSLLRYCENLIKDNGQESYVIVCGRWGKDLIAAAGLEVRESYEIGDTPTHEEALTLAERLKELYREGTVDEIRLVYQHYRSVLSQVPEQAQLLPLQKQEETVSSERRTIFEPDRDSLLNTLLDMYIGNTVHAILLEARTGEHSARMTAMTAAADNTEELINDLTLELNHARQAAITTEISEIAGGAEALRNNTAGG